MNYGHNRGTGFTLYRIHRDGRVAGVDHADTLTDMISCLENDYLPQSANGERYFIVALTTGIITSQYLVENQPRLVKVWS